MYLLITEECFSKTHSVHFWPNWVKHTILMPTMPLVQNSPTHPPTPSNTHLLQRKTPILTPSDLHTNVINTPTEPPPQTAITTTLPSPTHTQNSYFENKRVFFFYKTKTKQKNPHSVQSEIPCIMLVLESQVQFTLSIPRGQAKLTCIVKL